MGCRDTDLRKLDTRTEDENASQVQVDAGGSRQPADRRLWRAWRRDLRGQRLRWPDGHGRTGRHAGAEGLVEEPVAGWAELSDPQQGLPGLRRCESQGRGHPVQTVGPEGRERSLSRRGYGSGHSHLRSRSTVHLERQHLRPDHGQDHQQRRVRRHRPDADPPKERRAWPPHGHRRVQRLREHHVDRQQLERRQQGPGPHPDDRCIPHRSEQRRGAGIHGLSHPRRLTNEHPTSETMLSTRSVKALTLLSLKFYHPTMFQIIFTILTALLFGHSSSMKELPPVTYNDEFNLYSNEAHQFSVQYPKNLHPVIVQDDNPEAITFNTAMGYIAHTLTIEKTTLPSVAEWVKIKNQERSKEIEIPEMPKMYKKPIKILTKEFHDNTLFLTLATPELLELNKRNQGQYMYRISTIFIKDDLLYAIEQSPDFIYDKINVSQDFKHLIQTFHFTSTAHNDQFNLYTNEAHQFSVQYPNHFDLHILDADSASFSEKGTDGPWIINIQLTPTTSSTPYEWVKSENVKRKKQPPIRIVKEEKHEGVSLLYLKTPVSVDQTMDGKPIYVDQDSAILIKEKILYTILLRAQWDGEQLKKDFDDLVESFHFTP